MEHGSDGAPRALTALVTGAARRGGIGAAIAVENARHGVTANAILPGLVASSAVLSMPRPIIDAWLARIPTGRLVDTDEIAAAASFFASRAAASVTGQELTIDGGQTLNALSVTGSVLAPAGSG